MRSRAGVCAPHSFAGIRLMQEGRPLHATRAMHYPGVAGTRPHGRCRLKAAPPPTVKSLS
jgi:hypothetical protein